MTIIRLGNPRGIRIVRPTAALPRTSERALVLLIERLRTLLRAGAALRDERRFLPGLRVRERSGMFSLIYRGWMSRPSRYYQCVLNVRSDNEAEFESHKARFIKYGENLPESVRGIAFQEEKETTRHLQIHVEFNRPVRHGGVKRALGCDYLHIEETRSRAASYAYCTKEETREDGPWEFGVLGDKQGNRADIEALKDSLDEGKGDKDLWEEHFGSMLRYHKAVGVYRLLRMSGSRPQPRVRVYHGPPGTGKSHRAFQEASELGQPYFVMFGQGNTWWDGYDGRSPVIFDDFYDQIDVNMMKRILDKYPLQVQVKGGVLAFAPTDIWITSNHTPDEWWLETRSVKLIDRQAILRRIHETDYMGTVYSP